MQLDWAIEQPATRRYLCRFLGWPGKPSGPLIPMEVVVEALSPDDATLNLYGSQSRIASLSLYLPLEDLGYCEIASQRKRYPAAYRGDGYWYPIGPGAENRDRTPISR